MIEVNLLPGAKKAKRKRGPSIDFSAIGPAIAARFKDRFLAGAIAGVIVAAAIGGFLFISQARRAVHLAEAYAKAKEDSTNFAKLLRERALAQARRDSAVTQLNIIRAIDEDRYIWPHIMEEVSRALPIYTWIRSIGVLGTRQGTNPAAAVVRMPPPDTGTGRSRRRRPPGDVVIPRDTVSIRLIGNTVDIQALTRFMRSLEDSPFLGMVQLQRSEISAEAGREVTQFTLDVRYTRPDSNLLRRAPLTLTQR